MSEGGTKGGGLAIYGPPVRGRSCGSCKLCCQLVPVDLGAEGKKKANQACWHMCSKGCAIYAGRPDPCRAWSCRWLFDPNAGGMRRPDRGGYLVDPMLDTVLADGRPVEALQVWVDPARREAHRDPRLRAYLALMAELHGLPAMIRFGSANGFLLVAPVLSADCEWLELGSTLNEPEELAAKIAAAGGAGHKMRLAVTVAE